MSLDTAEVEGLADSGGDRHTEAAAEDYPQRWGENFRTRGLGADDSGEDQTDDCKTDDAKGNLSWSRCEGADKRN